MGSPQRHCLILQGDSDWLNQQAIRLYRQADADFRCWMSDSPQRPADAINSKQTLQQLGGNNQLIIFDGQDSFSADAFGTLIGTLQAGGWLLVLLPLKLPTSQWLQRFLKTANRYAAVQRIRQGDLLPEIHLSAQVSQAITPTQEQTQAIQAVLHVVSGHRRRPLVITSDRGRGKTALLGMAAAKLLKRGKTRILITAPALGNIQSLLEHAARLLPGTERRQNSLHWHQGEIQFIAPDALIADKPSGDLLIVDEAAAIPVQMLEILLQTYSRIVFSTTEHGYEGTGRGFVLRFKKTLERLTPDWRSVTLTQPVRWMADDGLESFSYDALLLDAEPVSDRLSSTSLAEASFVLLDKQQLLGDESQLRQVYGLMALAHYRTRPSDLQMMLDRDDISVLVMQAEGQVIASAWLVSEQPLTEDMAQQVFDGRRRLTGRLLPQTLLAHCGVLEAGVCRYQRVIRIAVHPALQGQGLGSRLLDHIHTYFSGHCDVIGTSFGLERDLLHFWLKNNYLPVRVGQQADGVSGQRAGILLHAVSKAGESVVTQAQQILQRTWFFLLMQAQCELNYELVILLSQTLPLANNVVLEMHERPAIESFAQQQRAYESTEPLLWKWLQSRLISGQLARLKIQQQALLVKKIIQGQPFTQVAQVLQLPGRKAIIEQLRQAVAILLKSGSE